MQKLIETLSVQTTSYSQWRMFAYIVRQLHEIPDITMFIDDGNLYVTRGDADTYPCMVAHMDTVHDITDDLHPICYGGRITGFDRVNMCQAGIGGDDKVGVYITLECLREFDVMKAVFFRDEEVGCHGSYGAVMDFFEDCRFVLQCDRKGNSDFVTNASGVELSSKEFQDDLQCIIESYGYSYSTGMMTDVMALKQNNIKCSVANMSCGYYRPHAVDEYVDVSDVENCLQMCRTIISLCTSVYPHKYKPKYEYKSHQSKSTYNKGLWTDWHSDKKSNSRIYYESDWDWVGLSDKKNKPITTYCRECWRGESVTKDGLCKTCDESYKIDNYLW